MLAAGAAGIIGALLDWVSILRLPNIIPASELQNADPVSGIEAGDGWTVLILAVVVANAALLLWVKRSSIWGWVGFLCSAGIGAIAIADYRAISDTGSGFIQDLEVIGEFEHGIGLLLVLAGGLLGIIFSLVGVAASPRTE
jgi:hypothetical protein